MQYSVKALKKNGEIAVYYQIQVEEMTECIKTDEIKVLTVFRTRI